MTLLEEMTNSYSTEGLKSLKAKFTDIYNDILDPKVESVFEDIFILCEVLEVLINAIEGSEIDELRAYLVEILVRPFDELPLYVNDESDAVRNLAAIRMSLGE